MLPKMGTSKGMVDFMENPMNMDDKWWNILLKWFISWKILWKTPFWVGKWAIFSGLWWKILWVWMRTGGTPPFVKPEDMGDGIVLEFPLPGWSWLPLIQSFDHGLNDWGPWLKSRPYVQISNMGGFLWIYGYVYSGKLRTEILSSFAIDLW